MKNRILQLIFLFSCWVITAQFGPQQIISNTIESPSSSFPLDIDNDGFIDILSLSGEDYKLRWFRNLDGEGNFGTEIFISENPGVYFSEFADIDTDGDKDILYEKSNPRIIGWLENLDGEGNFGQEQSILWSLQNFILGKQVEDLDNDGDNDLIVYFSDSHTDWIVWYENLDGLGNFGNEILLLDNITDLYRPVIVDIDNDGNLDILTSHENNGPAKLVWYRNLGNVIFGTEIEIHQFDYSHSDWTHINNIQYVDINTDEKKDIVVSTFHEDFGAHYYWFENIDNLGNFDSPQHLPISGNFVDIDNDGDIDILTGNRFVDRIYWVENSDGLGTFTTERTITTEVDFIRDINAADLNGDGLIDVVSASTGAEHKIAWYENTGVLGISENSNSPFKLYPNPAFEKVYIKSTTKISVVEIYNSLGKQIKTCINCNEINISLLASGNYIFKITDDLGNTENYKVLIK